MFSNGDHYGRVGANRCAKSILLKCLVGEEALSGGTLGHLLFSRKEIEKSVSVISGGEQGRMLFGKVMLQSPNI